MRPASCSSASLPCVLITALKLPVELMPRHHKGGGAAAVFRKFRRAGCTTKGVAPPRFSENSGELGVLSVKKRGLCVSFWPRQRDILWSSLKVIHHPFIYQWIVDFTHLLSISWRMIIEHDWTTVLVWVSASNVNLWLLFGSADSPLATSCGDLAKSKLCFDTHLADQFLSLDQQWTVDVFPWHFLWIRPLEPWLPLDPAMGMPLQGLGHT